MRGGDKGDKNPVVPSTTGSARQYKYCQAQQLQMPRFSSQDETPRRTNRKEHRGNRCRFFMRGGDKGDKNPVVPSTTGSARQYKYCKAQQLQMPRFSSQDETPRRMNRKENANISASGHRNVSDVKSGFTAKSQAGVDN